MNFDIVFVTYNSEKWLNNCLNSLYKTKYDLKNLHLYFYDNNSSDQTVKALNDYKQKLEFGSYEVISGNKNIGFGRGNNMASKKGTSDYIFFLNIDTEVYEDTFKILEEEIKSAEEKFEVFELRQVPYEHSKYYDPYTGEVSWASGACVVFKRSFFEELKGFDRNLFMYCEDVEISWNARKHGAKIKYLYNAKIKHFSYTSPNEFKENQFIYASVNNLYLRSKYGSLRNYLKGILLLRRARLQNFSDLTRFNNDYKYAKKVQKRLTKESIKMLFKSAFIFLANRFKKGDSSFKPKFVNDFDYEVTKLAPFYQIPDINLKKEPLVSILVRTHYRPEVLRETLKSIENQSYKNIEIVVVEDGEASSKAMIEKEFSHLNIVYHATKECVGRSKVGNIAMELAKGKYLNFLDDDDLFYPEHVETLVKELENSNYRIAYTTAFETPFIVHSQVPYIYEVKDIGVTHQGEFSKLNLYKQNITPIQAVMFEKEIFKECGGFDETIDACEDWDLWVRFSLNNPFLYIEKTTSLYRTPFDTSKSQERQVFLDTTLKYLDTKFKDYKPELTVQDIKNKRG